jgi:hypothetical protein
VTIVGCDNGSTNDNGNGNGNGNGGGTNSALNGTWIKDNGSEMTFNNGNFENFQNSIPVIKGTYTTNGNRYTRTVTHAGKFAFSNLESSKWYPKNELITLGTYTEIQIESCFNTLTAIYSIDGNKLTLTFDGTATPEIWARK